MRRIKTQNHVLPEIEQISASLTSSLKLNEIFYKTCQTAVKTFKVDHSGLVLFDAEFRTGRVEAEYPKWNLVGKTVPLIDVPDEERLIKTKKPLMVVDVSAQKSLGPIRDLLLEKKIKSILIVPVINKGQVLGSFSLDVSNHSRKFTAQEIKYCRVFAEQVATAIANAKLFSTLEGTLKHMEGLVTSSLDAVIFIDNRKCVAVFNKRAEEIFGYAANEIRGQTVIRLYNDINEGKKIWDTVNIQGKVIRHELILRHKNGTKIPALLSAVSIKDINGNEIGQAGFVHTSLIEDRLHALIRASQAVSSNLRLTDVLQQIIESAILAFPTAEKGVIHLYDENTGMLFVRANRGYSTEVAETVIFKVGEGRAGWVYKHGRPLVIGNIKKDKRFRKTENTISHPEIDEQKSTICVPLKTREKIVGTLSLDNLTIINAFKSEDIELLSTFADQVAIAIENAQLFEQTQRDLRIVGGFYESSSELSPLHDPNTSLMRTAEKVKNTMGALSVSITALDSAGRPYEKSHTGYSEKERNVRQKGLSGIVMQTGLPYIIPDVTKTKESVNPGMLKSGVKAAICLPLQSQGKTVGVMWVTYPQPHHFADTEVKLLGLLANQTGALINASRLFQERQLLLETSKLVSTSQDLNQSLQTLAEMMIRQSLAATFCRISILDDSGKMLTIRASYPVVGDLSWDPRIGQQYSLEESPEEMLPLTTGKGQVLTFEKNPKLLSSLEKKVSLNGVLKAAVIIPLSVSGTTFGVITLGERRGWERGSFTLERVDLWQSMADQVAALIARMRLQEQSEKDAANFRRLHEASSRIGLSLDPDQTLQFIVEKACQAMDGWRATAILLDENKQPHRLASIEFDKELKADTSIRPNGVSMEVIKTGTPFVIEDVRELKNKINPGMVQDGVKAAICLPLRIRNKNIGLLWIHYKEPRRFLPSQVEALKLYAAQAAISYDNACKMRELEHMHQAAEAIAGALELPQILQQIVESACQVLEADSSAIWAFVTAGDQFIPEELVAHQIPKELLEQIRRKEPKRGGTADTVMERGWVGVVDILDRQYQFIGSSTMELLKNINAKSFQGIALKIGEERLGVLYVNYNVIKIFTEEDRKTLETFAYHAAMALKKARLLEQVRKAQETAKVVAEMTVLGDKKATLLSVARGTQKTVECDAVVLFEYDQVNEKLEHPPVMVGVEFEDRASQNGEVVQGSIVYEMLQQDKPYIVEQISKDAFFKDRRFARDEGVQSCIAIPLKAEQQKVGVMFVNYRSLHRFTNHEVNNIDLFANQAAVAIRNAQLLSRTRRHAEALQGLYESGKAISGTLTLDETLGRIAEQALRVVAGNGQRKGCFSHITLLEEGNLSFAAAYPSEMLAILRNQFDISFQTSQKVGIAGRVAKSGLPENVKDVTQDSDYIQASVNTKSQLSIPIRVGERVIGVISIEHPEYGVFSDEDIKNVALLATQAGVSIENARLFKEAKQRADNLDAVLRVSQTVTSSLDLERILSATCQAAVELLGVDHSGLVLFDDKMTTGKVYAEYPEIGATGVTFPLHGVPVEEQLVALKEPLMVPDVAIEPGFDPVRHVLTKLGTCSILVIPILSKDRLLGSFGLDMMKQKRVFTKEEIELCKIFAAQVAVAIENAKQYEELRTMKALVGPRTATEWMRMVSMAWGHAIKRESGLGLRYLELIRQELESNDTIKAKQDLKSLANVIERIKDIPIVAPLAKEDKIMPIFVNDLLRKHIDRMWQHEPYLFSELVWNLEPDLDKITTVVASPQWVLRCLEIFIDNSINAMMDSNNSTPRVKITTRASAEEVQIFVTDNGLGFLPHLKLSTIGIDPVHKLEGDRGAGLGLVLAKNIAQTYGGDINVVDTNSNGTTMAISLPRA
jgi:PAS domain S-box-containing protein